MQEKQAEHEAVQAARSLSFLKLLLALQARQQAEMDELRAQMEIMKAGIFVAAKLSTRAFALAASLCRSSRWTETKRRSLWDGNAVAMSPPSPTCF